MEQLTALRALVDRLDDTAGLLAGIRDTVADAWDDPIGHAVTARLELVGREVHRLAEEAGRDVARMEDSAPTDVTADQDPADHDTAARHGASPHGPAGSGGPSPADTPGMRLPGLTGTRVTDRRGPVAPSLTDPPGR